MGDGIPDQFPENVTLFKLIFDKSILKMGKTIPIVLSLTRTEEDVRPFSLNVTS